MDSCRSGRQYLIVDIISINTAVSIRKNTALPYLRRVTDHNAVVIIDDIGDHIILLDKYLFIEDFRYLLVVIFAVNTKKDQIAACRIMRDRTGKAYKALTTRLSAAIRDKGSGRRAFIKTIHQPLYLKSFIKSFSVTVQQKTV